LTSDWLRNRHKRLTCLEVDRPLAGALGSRLRATNAQVLCGDATAMPYPDCVFTGAVALTMLHHVPSPLLQDRLFREVRRVLVPGGVFAGTDGMLSLMMRVFHIADTMVLIDPAAMPARLEAAGFREIKVEIGEGRFRFCARRPAA
jgi:SAM-dependent methyltransferase